MSKAQTTRLTILRKAFEIIYANGYKSTSIDDIIAETAVTKGAFFYHFKNKDDMGLAMINEVLYPGMYQTLVDPLLNAANPVDEIYEMMKNLLLGNPFFQVKYGCPAVNLIDELSSFNDDFKKALSKLVIQWQEVIEKSVRKGKVSGQINKDVNPGQVAFFVTSGYSGIRNLGKIFGGACYVTYLKELKKYLKSLQ